MTMLCVKSKQERMNRCVGNTWLRRSHEALWLFDCPAWVVGIIWASVHVVRSLTGQKYCHNISNKNMQWTRKYRISRASGKTTKVNTAITMAAVSAPRAVGSYMNHLHNVRAISMVNQNFGSACVGSRWHLHLDTWYVWWAGVSTRDCRKLLYAGSGGNLGIYQRFWVK